MIKIAIVDDNLALLESTREDLERKNNFEIVFTAPHGSACLDCLLSLKSEAMPEVILMDISMPKMDGIQATKEIQVLYPAIQVIMLTSVDEDHKVFESIRCGAKGYLLKTESSEEIAKAIEEVRKGGTQLTPSIARKVLSFLQLAKNEPIKKDTVETTENSNEPLLSPREHEILDLLSKGVSYQHIANNLFIAMGTVKKHIYNIYEKLQVSNKTQAVNRLKSL